MDQNDFIKKVGSDLLLNYTISQYFLLLFIYPWKLSNLI